MKKKLGSLTGRCMEESACKEYRFPFDILPFEYEEYIFYSPSGQPND